MTTPVQLFRRKVIVTVDTLQFTDLAVQFSIKKTIKPEPNTCELHLFNLNREHRSALEQLDKVTVQIEAGYLEGTSVLFLGDLRHIDSVREGADIVTTISSGDGEERYRKARVSVSVQKKTTTDNVLKQIAKALGVGEGNLSKAVASLKTVGLANLFSEGTVICGSASREMTHICRSVGLTWSIQDGKLQILPLGAALDGEAIKLTPETGLIGSPTVDSKGVLKAKMLMIPDVFPGRKMVLESERLKGQYRIEASTHTGDTHGGDWYIDVEAKRY